MLITIFEYLHTQFSEMQILVFKLLIYKLPFKLGTFVTET